MNALVVSALRTPTAKTEHAVFPARAAGVDATEDAKPKKTATLARTEGAIEYMIESAAGAAVV